MMKKIYPYRLKSARTLKGYSLQALADLLSNQISRQALHKYEKGLSTPDSKMLDLLSKALEVSVDYFYKEIRVEIGRVEFRKLDGFSQKQELQVITQTRDYLARYIELEEMLGERPLFENPIINLGRVTSYEQVNVAAEEIRKHWKLGSNPIFNVMELLENHNIKVVKINTDLIFDGMQTLVNGNIPVIAYNQNLIQKLDRVRFTLLHELAHLLLNFGDISEKQKETLCHQFAGAMLLPEGSLRSEIGDARNEISLPELVHIKKYYGISLQAIMMRARVCGIISDYSLNKFYEMINKKGWRIDEPTNFNYKGIEESNHFEQLLYRAIAEKLITFEKAASLKNETLTEFQNNFKKNFGF